MIDWGQNELRPKSNSLFSYAAPSRSGRARTPLFIRLSFLSMIYGLLGLMVFALEGTAHRGGDTFALRDQ